MYLGETTEYKKELAMIIEEFLNQRLLGLKNEVGVYVTQAFPKLLYVLDAILEMNKFIYNHIMYAEENTKSDYCQICGYDGEIKIIDEGGELIWECPNCHNRNKDKMNVARYVDRFGKRISISGNDLKDVKKRYNEALYEDDKQINIRESVTLDEWYKKSSKRNHFKKRRKKRY